MLHIVYFGVYWPYLYIHCKIVGGGGGGRMEGPSAPLVCTFKTRLNSVRYNYRKYVMFYQNF